MKFFPNKDIALLLADDDPVPRIYRFMEGADRLGAGICVYRQSGPVHLSGRAGSSSV